MVNFAIPVIAIMVLSVVSGTRSLSKYRHDLRFREISKHIRTFKKDTRQDWRKASTSFMLDVYNALQSGSSLIKAAGRVNLNKADLTQSDTVRSFAPKGRGSFAV